MEDDAFALVAAVDGDVELPTFGSTGTPRLTRTISSMDREAIQSVEVDIVVLSRALSYGYQIVILRLSACAFQLASNATSTTVLLDVGWFSSACYEECGGRNVYRKKARRDGK